MKMKSLMFALVASFLLAFSIPLSAQTTVFASWGQAEDTPTAQGFVYSLKIDGGAFTTLTAQCSPVSPGVGSLCGATVTGLANPAAAHTFVLQACTADGTKCAATSATSGAGSAPNTTGFKVVITVTVTTGDDDAETE